MGFQKLVVFLLTQKALYLVGFAELHFEEPSLVEARGVDEARLVLDFGVLLGDRSRHGRIHLAGRLHALEGAALVPLRDDCSDVRQLGVDHVAEGLLRVVGDAHHTDLALHPHPLVLLCVFAACGRHARLRLELSLSIGSIFT